MPVERIRELMVSTSASEPELPRVFNRLCNLLAGLDSIFQEDIKSLDGFGPPQKSIHERQVVVSDYRFILGTMAVWTLDKISRVKDEESLLGTSMSLQRFYDETDGQCDSSRNKREAMDLVQGVQGADYGRKYLHLEV